jgi:hypothetical protein
MSGARQAGPGLIVFDAPQRQPARGHVRWSPRRVAALRGVSNFLTDTIDAASVLDQECAYALFATATTTATAPPDPPAAAIPSPPTAKPRGNPNLHLARRCGAGTRAGPIWLPHCARRRPAETPCTRGRPRGARRWRAKTLFTVPPARPTAPASAPMRDPRIPRTPSRPNARKPPAGTQCTRRRVRPAPNRGASTPCTNSRRRPARHPARGLPNRAARRRWMRHQRRPHRAPPASTHACPPHPRPTGA